MPRHSSRAKEGFVVLKVSRGADGKLKATVDSLDQSATDLRVDTIIFQDGTLKFEMKRLLASYVATLSKDGTQLTGQPLALQTIGDWIVAHTTAGPAARWTGWLAR
ncbi:MAG TPA: hypothetical protein VGJ55_20105 [Pyrinomonadaceae bacterium]|jgi:hypothetical protein